MSGGGKVWRAETVVVVMAALLALPGNLALWEKLLLAQPPQDLYGITFLVAAAVLLASALALLLLLLPLRWVGRPLLTLLWPMAALTGYFMQEYGVAIDDTMLRNVFETDAAEAWQLLSLPLLAEVLLGLLPVWWLWRVPLRRLPPWPALRARLLAIGASLAVIGVVAALFYPGFASLFRNHRELRLYLLPTNIVNGLRHYAQDAAVPAGPLQAVGGDAHRVPRAVAKAQPTVVVLVIGETARAGNFALSGYARDTNPELARQSGIVYFGAVHSCGTETAVSLPCMLSNLGRSGFSPARAEARENLLDVAARAGVDVVWVENQSGCKHTCDRVRRVNTQDMGLPQYCQDGECHDGILVEALRRELDHVTRDTLVVLHQMGSHGPAYHLRYPQAFERFTPVCRTNLLDRCSTAQIRNAYDNTILYTDHVLAGLVDILRADARHDSALLYMSDHGESLGELGLYLHGAPRLLAPETQVHVPMLAWLSPRYQQATGVRTECVAGRAGRPVTHDNLFHSMLGMLGIATQAYDASLDLFSPCEQRWRQW